MIYLQIDDDKIPIGNFSFIYDYTHNEELFFKFYEAEKNIKVDYIDFAHKIRRAFEAFALDEEARKRKHQETYKNIDITVIKEQIVSEIKQPASLINYKNIIIDLCAGRELEFSKMLLRYSFVEKKFNKDIINRKFKSFIRFLYAFGSENSHENVSFEKKYIANKENCLKVIKAFHDFLCIYFGEEKKYDTTLIPIKDYIAIPKRVVDKMGLTLGMGKSLFVKEKGGKITYYIFSSNIDGISQIQKRDIDIINKLWEENFVDPSNVIRQIDNITSSNGDYKFQVYSLPNKPFKLTNNFINEINIEQKKDIIIGLCRGVKSIHTYDTPLYHRNINPDVFYIFEIKGKYKPLLAKFEYAKDTADAGFTVLQYVEKKARNHSANKYFAPEVIKSDMGVGIDWGKADIYSLAMTIAYIILGKVIDSPEDLIDIEKMDDELKIILIEMLDSNPQNRPNIESVLKIFEIKK